MAAALGGLAIGGDPFGFAQGMGSIPRPEGRDGGPKGLAAGPRSAASSSKIPSGMG
jgi:hypothetical protein